MSSAPNTPTLVATGNISPGCAVKVATSADLSGTQASAVTDILCGFADLSTNADGTYNAVAGESIKLQQGPIYYVAAGAAITRGALLEIDSTGRVITQTTATGMTTNAYQALQSAVAAGEFIYVIAIPNYFKRS